MGKTSKQEATINPQVAQAAANNYAMAQDIARLGYQPNRGVTIAGFTPQQEAAMRGTQSAAAAFGMPQVDPMSGMPQTEMSATGIRGYSTGAEYDDMKNRLPAGYRQSIDNFFVDPNKVMRRTAPQQVKSGGGGKK